MTLKQFLAEGRLRRHTTNPREIRDEVFPELLGSGFQDLADYFDQCRDKRNVLDYDRAGEIVETEAEELLQEARKLRTTVLAWLRRRHPRLVRR